MHFRKDDLFGTILPSKFFEDAAMERPILLGFEGDARAMLEEADCGIAFEPSNDEELAAAAEAPGRRSRPRSGGGWARTAAATSWSTSTAASSRTTTSRSSSACAPTTGEAAGEPPVCVPAARDGRRPRLR